MNERTCGECRWYRAQENARILSTQRGLISDPATGLCMGAPQPVAIADSDPICASYEKTEVVTRCLKCNETFVLGIGCTNSESCEIGRANAEHQQP